MVATREQLQARWKTPEGIHIAENFRQLFERHPVSQDELQKITTTLPFSKEVAPALDLRGLNLPSEVTSRGDGFILKHLSLPGAHFEYLQDVANIVVCDLQGAIFDEMHTIHSIFGSDFRRASFRKAMLQGVRFWRADLRGATFFQARLAKADFSEVPCQGASFVEADMRFTLCAGTDFRGADLRRANLTESSLGGVLFDEKTLLEGTILRAASIEPELRSYAEKAGAILSAEDANRDEYTLACADALIKAMQEKEYNPDGHLDAALPYMLAYRQKLAQGDSDAWYYELGEVLENVVSKETIDEIFESIYPDAMRLLAYYL
ncbi:pentapeptide repeat-containing protein [Tengunoibacter tsumagoiensis]|uniref:Pentapeptide repeat-containing protein n=1 Tax=Tengunoibacter tsumagoiensis TaxID=2014871 RepID=A0A401ZVN5_9CHLR|nr:pentapeptide repeat-containing protein [Tengunoibacter tsumagoiensis]GCE10810.1 hypothetical protein KTT_06690 [Tengunoibacter tsumagoiensis]